MPKPPDHLLGFTQHSDAIYELETPHGYITTEFRRLQKVFHVGYVQVDYDAQRSGHGRFLIEQARALASQLGAETIVATIKSEAGMGLFSDCFGVEHITGRSLVYPVES